MLAGAIGGTTGVFAKSVVELSKNGIAGGASWQHPATYAIIVALLGMRTMMILMCGFFFCSVHFEQLERVAWTHCHHLFYLFSWPLLRR